MMDKFSIKHNIFSIVLIIIFITIPIAEIDSAFNYNEVFIFYGHEDCNHLKCNLINYL